MKSNLRLHNLLMLLLGLVVIWSLLGISKEKVEGEMRYSLIIKTEPSLQVFY